MRVIEGKAGITSSISLENIGKLSGSPLSKLLLVNLVKFLMWLVKHINLANPGNSAEGEALFLLKEYMM